MTGDPATHWRRLYEAAVSSEVSWYQPVPERSLELIRATGVARAAPLLDVGGGASTLADYLLAAGFSDVTVLDIAPSALELARSRLGPAAAQIQWIVTDITEFQPARRYALWHDRAVFHFLVDPLRRRRYLEVLGAALAPGGHLLLATFGPEGPTHCSGLKVQRYAADEISAALGRGFHLVQSLLEDHVTPRGHRQQFLYGWWQHGPGEADS